MRRIAATVALALGLSAAVAVVAAPAEAASTTPGAYIALNPSYRALDSYSGVNGNLRGALAHGGVTTVSLAQSHVPSTAGAALVSISSVGSTAGGNLTAYAAGTPLPNITDVQYATGVTTTDTVVVALGTGADAGRFSIHNGAFAGATNLVVDVRGYYVGGTVSADQSLAGGLLHTVTPTRLLDSATASPSGVGANQTVSMSLGSAQAGRGYVLISVLNSTSAGSVAGYAGPDDSENPQSPPYGDVYFPARASVTGLAIVPTDSTGEFTLVNHSSGPVRIVVDFVAWAVGGAAATSYGSQVAAGQRLVSAQSLAAGKIASYGLPGNAGTPLASVSAVVVRIIVASPTASGGIDVGGSGATSSNLRTLTFLAGQTVSTTTITPLVSGRINVRNSSGGSLKVYLDVLGFVPTSSHPLPAPVDVGRYPNDLTDTLSSDMSTMSEHGCTDAAKGATFVLLDIGAQSISAPLSSTNGGVELATTTVHISYPDLVSDVVAYLNGYRGCSNSPVTVAVGTNNDGAWTPGQTGYYSPAARGADWVNDVILPITAQAPTGVAVWGADDIEPGFASTEAQALAWEDSYLSVLATVGDTTPLLFNGSADGCPVYFGQTSACANGWTQAQIANLAYHGGRVEALPQIYGHSDAVKWTNIAGYVSGLKLHFLGSLTESADPESYLPEQGWASLYRALTSKLTAPSLPRAVDIAKDS